MKFTALLASSCFADCDFDDVRSFCSFTKNVLMLKDCDGLNELLPPCMEIMRGPPGYKMIHADVTECVTETGINERGFFTFGNQLNNGFVFHCESIINSKVAISSGYTDGDSEHGENYAKMKTIEIYESSVTTENDIDTIVFNVDSSTMKAPANIQYSVDSCELVEYLGTHILNKQSLIDKNCVKGLNQASTFLTFDATDYRGIPLGVDATRLKLTRDHFYQYADVTFAISCEVTLCPMNEKESVCAASVASEGEECMRLE